MSFEYDQYLENHRANVKRGYEWLLENLPDILIPTIAAGWQTSFAHDKSKNEPDEYEAYDTYFYGNNRSYAVVQNYQRAWLLHIHRNPHHWQHWVLINDNPKEGEIVLEMPYDDIIEMICDWWAFSWKSGNLREIFTWYDEHSKYMKLGSKTRERVEKILGLIKDKLDELENSVESDELAHHGVKGQKWGVKNGPPYPIQEHQKVARVVKRDNIESAKIVREKFTEYALNFDRAPDKAQAFKQALGYTQHNCDDLIRNINDHFSSDKLEERGDTGYGMRYQQIMKLKGPNGKEANVLTAWIKDGRDSVRLTSAYVTKKEESK